MKTILLAVVDVEDGSPSLTGYSKIFDEVNEDGYTHSVIRRSWCRGYGVIMGRKQHTAVGAIFQVRSVDFHQNIRALKIHAM